MPLLGRESEQNRNREGGGGGAVFAYEGRFNSVQFSSTQSIAQSVSFFNVTYLSVLFSSLLLYSMAHLLPFCVLLVCHICVSSLSLSLIYSHTALCGRLFYQVYWCSNVMACVESLFHLCHVLACCMAL